MNNKLIEELYKTIEAKDKIIDNQALEIARLKEQQHALLEAHKIQEELLEDKENKIDKAIEYINKITIELLEEVEKHKLTPFKETIIGKDLLEILGDDNNE